MIDKFSGTLEGWLAFPLRSGLFFWMGGLLGWLANITDQEALKQLFTNSSLHYSSLVSLDWQPFWHWLTKLKPEYDFLVFFSFLFFASLASMLVKQASTPILRFLEGYGWPRWLTKWSVQKILIKEKRWQKLTSKCFNETQKTLDLNKLTIVERYEYVKLDQTCMYLPSNSRYPPKLEPHALVAALIS